MRNFLISSAIHAIVIGAACLPASAAARAKAKPEVAAKCDTPVVDVLHKLADGTKGISISKALTDKQYAFLKNAVKEHTKLKKEVPGDGAFVIASDGGFIVALTQGLDESAMVCAVMQVPLEIVAGIVTVDKPIAPPDEPKDEKSL